MNDYFERSRGGLNAMYYWEQFHPILAAIAILIIGWIIALVVAAGIKKLLQKLGTNQKLSNATGHRSNIENIVSRIVFWIVMIIAVIGALNALNLNSVSGPFSSMVQQFLLFVPQLLAAVAVGFIGWLVANVAKVGLQKLLDRTSLDEKLSAEVGVSPISQNISEIVYWLILLLFLPIVLSILGLNGLLYPVQNMVNQAVGFLPNLFIAGIIVFAGYILAKIVRGIVEGLGNSLNLQQQAEKIGLFKGSNLPRLLGSFLFAVVMITALIVAFEALGVEAISQPATAMLHEIMNAIPHIIAAGLILIVAYVVSRFVAKLVVEVLAGTGVDNIPAKVGVQRFLGDTKVSCVVGYLIVLFTMLFAVSEAANRLGFDQISDLIAMFIYFGANILLGAVILVIGFWLANIVANVVQRGEYKSSRWLANLVRVLIMGLVLAMGLRAMGIADSIVNLAFGLTLGAVAVAFALAFGLGGRNPAERVLSDLIDKAKREANEPNPEPARAPDLMKAQSPAPTAATKTPSMKKADSPIIAPVEVVTDKKPSSPDPDVAVPDSLVVNPEQKPLNNPYGSTGEPESDTDIRPEDKK
ncbi:mechanosensitive ion channel [Acinetobacter sp. B51(2017)]|uniref:mechanosensitive ion channel n=1 Tax=Acinetobacter sp. B51(2017) TaxID=2060938 RepID=UPI000F094ED0|nr:mechanosensitive ion channel [Acinetobacter sp. B51(2017)]